MNKIKNILLLLIVGITITIASNVNKKFHHHLHHRQHHHHQQQQQHRKQFHDNVDQIINSTPFNYKLTNEIEKDWWQTASFYQIYPRSFSDSNGDGIGDLNGIHDNLAYLAEIGIKSVWLSPIFKSPNVDFGYDISDYLAIQPEFGTIDDFDRLIVRAKEVGIKILLDFVPNHTSDQHEWFERSVKKEEFYKDFYVWHPGFIDPKNSTNRLPPNNWISMFYGSAWKFHPIRGEFYLHIFYEQQPDLNYQNPNVVEAMKNVLRFWLDRGVSGFRIDAIGLLFEVVKDINGNFPDEPISGYTNDTLDWNYLDHIYLIDQPGTIEMVYEWRDVIDQHAKENGGDSNILMAEWYYEDMAYYGNGSREGAQIPFNSCLMGISNDSKAIDFKNKIDDWLKRMPTNRTPNWLIGNHDNPRVGSRVGTDHIDIMNMVVLTLPGMSITYYGEEIGMTDLTVPVVNDRDPQRSPFQWDDSTNAGFSTNPKPWLPVNENYKTINVMNETISEGNSYLKVYVALMELRKNAITLQNGDLTTITQGNALIILRKLINEPTYITLANIGDTVEHINLVKLLGLFTIEDKLIYQVVGTLSKHIQGESVDATKIQLEPKECFVLKMLTHGEFVRVDLYESNNI